MRSPISSSARPCTSAQAAIDASRAVRFGQARGQGAREAREGPGRHRAQPCVARNRDLAAEHQPEALRMVEGESDVGLAHGAQPARLPGIALRRAQPFEALRGERREERLALREMPVRRVMRDPCAARHGAQAECLKSFFFKDIPGRAQQRLFEVAMVVAALAGFRC